MPTDEPVPTGAPTPAEPWMPGNPAHFNFRTGLKPTPGHKIANALARGLLRAFEPKGASPSSFFMIPDKRSIYMNGTYGVCVTSEAAYDIAAVSYYCTGDAYMISDDTLMAFAKKYNVVNGADLVEVMQAMEQDGFHQGSDTLTEGKYAAVDYTNLSAIQNAISNGGGNNPNCLKVAISSSDLPQDAGNKDGWHAFGHSRGGSTDHCIAYSGYGTAKECFAALKQDVPSGVDPSKPDCVIAYTWATEGVVDMPWIVGTTVEAYIRASVMRNGTPWTKGPGPGPGPTPTGNNLVLTSPLAAGSYDVVGLGTLTLPAAVQPGIYPITSGPSPTSPGNIVLATALTAGQTYAVAGGSLTATVNALPGTYPIGAGGGPIPFPLIPLPSLITVVCSLYSMGLLKWLPPQILAVIAAFCALPHAQQQDVVVQKAFTAALFPCGGCN